MTKQTLRWLAVAGFLLPNFVGFLIFTFFPVLLSFVMSFSNWSLKPAVKDEFLAVRNYTDLLGAYALEDGAPFLRFGYVILCVFLLTGAVGSLWTNLSGWRGVRMGNALLGLSGFGILVAAALGRAPQAVWVAGLVLFFCGTAVSLLSDDEWKPGRGIVFPFLLAGGALGVTLLHEGHWGVYELRDERFWKFLYNTVFLMLGIPFTIAGSLVLSLMLNERIPFKHGRVGVAGGGMCFVGGVLSFVLLWWLGYPNIGLLVGVLWLVAALGVTFNVVAFRTIFYLPQFTSGVAIMILWKALYNPETGPINHSLGIVFGALGLEIDPPTWLSSVAWAKPALMIMGFWIGIGGTNMLLYLAGLSNVSQELIDAAHVDGADGWQRFRHVVWPQLAPTTFFILIMSVIGGLQGGFEQARVMTGGGPAGSTTTLSYYIYNKAFQDLDLGYAAAISWVLFAMIFLATAVNWRFGKELEVT